MISTPVVARELPTLSVTVHPRFVVGRTRALVPIAYEGIAISLYWWRGWL